MASKLPKSSGLKPPQSKITRSMGSIPESSNLWSDKPIHSAQQATKTQSCKKPKSKPTEVSKNNPPRKGLGSNNPASTIVGKAKSKISVVKRPHTVTISNGEGHPKPKMKIPDWDFKGRFNQLNEKYQELLKEIKLKTGEINKAEVQEQLTESNENLKSELTTLQKKYRQLEADFKILEENNKKLSEEKENLESELTTLQKKYRQLEADFKILEENNKKLSEEKVFISRIYNLK